jgi:UDP-N-acetylmuramate--alanine ligase
LASDCARADLIRRDFTTDAARVNARWCGDITYIATWEGWLFLATVIDIASRRVAGFAMADHLRTELVADALGSLRTVSSRRMDVFDRPDGVTVIDDFAHNPDKIAATLATLRAQPGRLLIMFQPHGYGPLTKMGELLANSLAEWMAPGDRLYLPDPVYQGGTVDKVRGSDWLANQVRAAGRQAEHIPERPMIGDALIAEAKKGDRILIMGARDDTLIDFARDLVQRIAETTSA